MVQRCRLMSITLVVPRHDPWRQYSSALLGSECDLELEPSLFLVSRGQVPLNCSARPCPLWKQRGVRRVVARDENRCCHADGMGPCEKPRNTRVFSIPFLCSSSSGVAHGRETTSRYASMSPSAMRHRHAAVFAAAASVLRPVMHHIRAVLCCVMLCCALLCCARWSCGPGRKVMYHRILGYAKVRTLSFS